MDSLNVMHQNALIPTIAKIYTTRQKKITHTTVISKTIMCSGINLHIGLSSWNEGVAKLFWQSSR